MRASRLALIPLTLAALAVGCTAPGGGTGGGGGVQLPGQPAGPKITVQDGRAPGFTKGLFTVRADQAIRAGDSVTLALSVAGADILRLTPSTVTILTSDGRKIEPEFQDREITAFTNGTINLSVPVPDRTVKSLEIGLNTFSVPTLVVPIPTEDGALAWQPAPLRQVGLDQQVQRTARNEIVFDAVRSEGLITEVDFHAAGINRYAGPTVCGYNFQYKGCTITEPNGTVHPLIGYLPDQTPTMGRASGTLRFLGELDPTSTELSIAASYDTEVHQPDPVKVTLPSHADSPTVPAPGTLLRPAKSMQPVTITEPLTGAKITVKDVAVLADQVQVQVAAVGGKTPFDLAGTSIKEPNGYIHPFAPSAAPMSVAPGATAEATLAFRGSVPADVTQFTFYAGGDNATPPATAQLTVPAGDPKAPAAPGTLGQLAGPAESAAPTLLATPSPLTIGPSPSQSPQASILSMDTTKVLPKGRAQFLPRVASAIKGTVPATAQASDEVAHPQQEVEVQRSLQELGAQKTADGYVLTLPETVLFDYNKADIKPDADTTLEKVGKLLAYYDKAKVKVQGHTDSDGEDAANLDLSKRRAEAVAKSLQGKSIASSRMTVEGFGEAKPVAPNDNDANKAKNRRVTIVLNEAS